MTDKLKILLVLQTPWGTGLGMSKVHYDLKVEYEKLGHEVNYLDWNKLYPNGQSAYDRIAGPLYSERILKYLKQHASRYDVIDANFNCIPYPKKDYNFKGVVMYRSHGLQPLYRQIEHSAAYKKMEAFETTNNSISMKTRVGNLNRYLQKKDTDIQLFNSVKYADVVHALNEAEYEYFSEYGVPKEQLVLVPNGIPDEQLQMENTIDYEEKKELSFIGSWTIRKGIKDLNLIIKEALKKAAITKINILGGGGSADSVYPFFDTEIHPLLFIKPHFSQQELPDLLRKARIGIFPSYVEGFGLAILEQLACGIPVVAYNTPGPAGILHPINDMLLIQTGNRELFGKRIAEIMSLKSEPYKNLALQCSKRAVEFRMSIVAKSFITAYRDGIERLNKIV